MRDRTADLLRAKQALSQLSYGPVTPYFSLIEIWKKGLFLLIKIKARKRVNKYASTLSTQATKIW